MQTGRSTYGRLNAPCIRLEYGVPTYHLGMNKNSKSSFCGLGTVLFSLGCSYYESGPGVAVAVALLPFPALSDTVERTQAPNLADQELVDPLATGLYR